jgi:hypothetical protein
LKNSFTIPRAEASSSDESALIAKLVGATGSETDATSILRSMQRIGTDPSILFYEMTLMTRGPRNGGVSTSAWRVRADRGRPVVEPAPDQPGQRHQYGARSTNR